MSFASLQHRRGRIMVWFALFLFTLSITAPMAFAQKQILKKPTPQPDDKDYYKQSRQLVLVITKDWTSIQGRLQRYKRANDRAAWKPVEEAFDVVIGRNGLAWGIGLPEQSNVAEPTKREGDGKSPAGIFKLSSVFGFAPREEAKWLKMPYEFITESTECVDDVKSSHYNRIRDRYKVGNFDWSSSEKMLEVGEQYRWGVVVDHNANPPKKGAGSCIFLHIWANATTGTAGCTAMEKGNVETLLRWLDEKKKPALVQLPQAEYERLRTSWKLP
jgi:D-alanyl-D-alanine dipeptidase